MLGILGKKLEEKVKDMGDVALPKQDGYKDLQDLKGTFEAYPAETVTNNVGNTPKLFLLLLVFFDIMLVGSQPILVQFSKVGGHYKYNPVTVNLCIEVSKASIMICIIFFRKLGVAKYGKTSLKSFAAMISSNRILAVPALLYAINNYLKFVMQLYFEPTTVKMVQNLKVFFIALLSKALLRRNYSVYQWEALVLLVFGVTINNMSLGGSQDGTHIDLSAWLYTSGSILVACVASVYNEKVFKGSKTDHVFIQCFCLYFFGTLFNSLGVMAFTLANSEEYGNMFKGMTYKTTLIILTNSCQGVLASLFLKFADTILKKFSSNIATLVTGLLSALFFHKVLTSKFFVALSMVFIALHQFYNLKPGFQVPFEDSLDSTRGFNSV